MTSTPVWLRAATTREGDDVVTRVCVVMTDGSGRVQCLPLEVRVNLPQLAGSLRSMGLGPADDGVGGFGSFLKKAVKSVTHSKVVRAVSHAVGKVVKNPIVQLANPMMAISAHTIAKSATGTGTIKGAAGKLVDSGTAVVTKAVPIPSAMSFVSPKAAAALGVGLRTVTSARAAGVISAVAKNAAAQVNLGRQAAAVLESNPANAAARQLVQRAVAVRSGVTKNAAALAKKVVLSAKVKASVANIAAQARAGSSDARLAASVIARSARALDSISALQQASTGGVAGMLITADGRIVRSSKGRFVQRSSAAARPDVLYRGPKEPTLRGSFSAVSGGWNVGATQSWGGDLDPGNDLDGPMYGVTPESQRVLLDDYSAVAGVLTP